MPRISELPSTAFPSLLHLFAASLEGETHALSLQQVRDLLAYQASEIARGETTVEEVLATLESSKADADTMVASLFEKVDKTDFRPAVLNDYTTHWRLGLMAVA